MSILGWKAWSTLAVYDSRSTAPKDLPDDLQWVVLYKENGYREMITGAKSNDDVWYVFYPEGNVLRDEGVQSVVQQRHPFGHLVRGVWTADANYERIAGESWATKWEA